jgi:hypothetical protein
MHEFESGYISPGASLSFVPKQRLDVRFVIVSIKESRFNLSFREFRLLE